MWTVILCFVISIIISVSMGLPGLLSDLKKMESEEADDWMCYFGFHRWGIWGKPESHTFWGMFGYKDNQQFRHCANCGKQKVRRF